MTAGQDRCPSTSIWNHHGREMPEAEAGTAEAEQTIVGIIRRLLALRGATEVEVTRDSNLTADLDLDSLELAELSAALEDNLGRDPYSEGLVPVTVGELVAYYAV